MMEYFYGFNVSGVMTLWVGWGEALTVLRSVKCRKLGTAFRGTQMGPQRLRFVPKYISQVRLSPQK